MIYKFLDKFESKFNRIALSVIALAAFWFYGNVILTLIEGGIR